MLIIQYMIMDGGEVALYGGIGCILLMAFMLLWLRRDMTLRKSDAEKHFTHDRPEPRSEPPTERPNETDQCDFCWAKFGEPHRIWCPSGGSNAQGKAE